MTRLALQIPGCVLHLMPMPMEVASADHCQRQRWPLEPCGESASYCLQLVLPPRSSAYPLTSVCCAQVTFATMITVRHLSSITFSNPCLTSSHTVRTQCDCIAHQLRLMWNARQGHISLVKGFLYWVAQISGGIIGTLLTASVCTRSS